MSRSAVVVLLGLVVWAISWFVSPHEMLSMQSEAERKIGDLTKALEKLGGDDAPDALRVRAPRGDAPVALSPKGPPGWRAFRFSWDMLTGEFESKDADAWKTKVLGFTGLTNLAMLAAVVLTILRGSVGTARAMGAVLLACVALNLSWLYLTDEGFRGGLEAGYWLWAASFAVAGVGFRLRA
jgi:hypothetical protein